MIIIKTAGSGVLKKFGVGIGNHEGAMPMVDNATSALAAGVKNPIKNENPLTASSKPISNLGAVLSTR